MARPADIRATGNQARALWFGSLTVGAVIGGCLALSVALYLTKEKPC